MSILSKIKQLFDYSNPQVANTAPASTTVGTVPEERNQTTDKPPPKAKKPRKKKQEPKIDVVKFDFDPKNPKLGSIELDWNDEFIKLLKQHGYMGATNEDIVDAWLNDVCRTIIADQYQGASVRPSALAGTQLVNKRPLEGGKSEIS